MTVGSVDEFVAGRIKADSDVVEDTGMSEPLDLKTTAPNSTGTDKQLPEGHKVRQTHSATWGHQGLAVRPGASLFATPVTVF